MEGSSRECGGERMKIKGSVWKETMKREEYKGSGNVRKNWEEDEEVR